MKKRFFAIAAIVIVLSLVCYIGVSFAYFLDIKKLDGTITLGELDFTVSAEFEKEMFALPNKQVLCDLSVKNAKESGEYSHLISFYLRFKILAQSNNVNVLIHPILNNKQWYFDGEYYYYKNVVNKNESVNICSSSVVDKNTGNDVQGNMLEVNVIFEAIQFNAVKDLWGDVIYKNLNNF